MEFAAAISSACALSYQIYTRCSASHGEFQRLSQQALSIHDVLKTLQSVCQQGTLRNEQHDSLKARVIPLRDLLETVDARLKTYSSLGTASPRVSDKIAWAAAGGASDVRDELNSLLQGLTALNTSILLQQDHRQVRRKPAPRVSTIDIDVEAQLRPSEPPIVPPANSVQPSSRPLKFLDERAAPALASGSYILVDGFQLVIFSMLSLVGIGVLVAIMCFYIINVMLFPLVALPSFCMGTKMSWKDCDAFWRDLCSQVWGFTKSLWD